MVHAPEAEKAAAAEAWAVNRTLFGGNEFYIVGPESDPVGIKMQNRSSMHIKK